MRSGVHRLRGCLPERGHGRRTHQGDRPTPTAPTSAKITCRVLSRHTGYDANLTRAVLEACAAACKAWWDECSQHAEMHEHCRVCAEACRRCEVACRALLESLA